MPAIRAARAARAADLGAIADLERVCFGAHALPRLVVRQYFELFADLILVVDGPAGALHGVAYGGLGTTKPADGWVLGVAVDPAQRRRGLADTLLTALFPRLTAAGAARVFATVHPDNAPSRALFARHGFVEAGRDDAYFGPGEPRIRLARPAAT